MLKETKQKNQLHQARKGVRHNLCLHWVHSVGPESQSYLLYLPSPEHTNALLLTLEDAVAWLEPPRSFLIENSRLLRIYLAIPLTHSRWLRSSCGNWTGTFTHKSPKHAKITSGEEPSGKVLVENTFPGFDFLVSPFTGSLAHKVSRASPPPPSTCMRMRRARTRLTSLVGYLGNENM